MNTHFIASIAAASLLAIAASSATAQNAAVNQYAQLQKQTTAAPDKVDMSAVPDLDRQKIRNVQSALRKKGFDAGPANGVLGDKTKEAVRKFQDRFGIKASGEIDNQTLFALGITDSKPASAATEPPEKKEPAAKKTTAREPAARDEPESRKVPRKKRERATREKPAPKKYRRTVEESEERVERRGRWCATYSNGGKNCGFYSFKQCRDAISGVGGVCNQSP